MKRIYLILVAIGCFLLPTNVEAQKIQKLIEFLTIHPNKKAVQQDSSLYPAKAIFTPVISFSPETSLSLGIGMKGLFKMKGSGPETRTSNIPLTAQYTIENKYLFFSGFEIFSPQERYMLTGNLSFQAFPSLYFGIGPDTPKTNEEEFSYRQILVEPIFLKQVLIKHLFLGAGIRYNRISKVEPEPDGLLVASDQPGSLGSNSVGVQLAMVYDSRDNLLNAQEGMYIEFTHGFYGKVLGGTQKYELTRFDLRFFKKAFNNPKSIVGFQFITHFSNGNTPFQEMGRLGGDEIMRGYFEGRYTDRHLIATQFEWRQKLSRLWGVVAFAGVGGVAPSIDKFSIANTRPSAGVGFRFLVDPHENLNIRLDFGFGQEKVAYYFKIAEAF